MTIQRQYSLPNCKLVLEGWGDESESSKQAGFAETRPAMTILVNAECHFSGHEQSIQGDRAFLESLMNSTSQYAQQVLSGVPHLEHRHGAMSQVQLQQVNPHVHRLMVRSPQTQDATASTVPPETSIAEIDLSTVQLFDLVEAIDQMVADAQTLPDLSMQLASVSKRGMKSQEPLAERVIPAALGISSLAAAAIALFFIPPPEFRPTEQEPTANEQVIDAGETDTTGETESTSDNEAVESEEAEAENSDAAESSPGSSASSDSDANGQSATVEDLPSEEDVEDLFAQASLLSDQETQALVADVRERLDEAWDNEPSFDEPLEYRVAVSEAGDIVGFSYPGENRDLAIEYVNELPLLDLLVLPDNPSAFEDEAIAQLRIVFQPSGVVEVSSWF
ncbi:MAG: DUF4335 domain-containing protein [Elainellaceae cyanobacterium]